MREKTFIVLFRGVGGKTQLPTKPLRAALGEAGFRNVATYIASGNAVLTTALSAGQARRRIAEIAREKFGFTKAVMLVPLPAWSRLIARNPFPEAASAPTTLHAFILEEAPPTDRVAALTARAAPTERIEVEGKVLYFHAPEGFGPSKLPPLVDKTLATESTARNWNTVLKLENLAKQAASAAARR
jgi:uncharacterized protein (DUF1697 family)